MTIDDKQLIEYYSAFLGCTEEELKENIPPDYDIKMLHSLIEHAGKYQLVAEVVTAKFCGAGLKPGQKYVVNSFVLDQEKTTAPICMGVMGELLNRAYAVFDRHRRPFKEEDMLRPITGIRCFDPGWELGGGGTVELKVWVEKIE